VLFDVDTLLRLLYDHIAGGYDFTVRFKWQKNSVAVWDNRVTVHNGMLHQIPSGRENDLPRLLNHFTNSHL
jgi:sulfonate dioxygenase